MIEPCETAHRATDCRRLLLQLKKLHVTSPVKFPAKKLFSNYETRKEGLVEFLQSLINDAELRKM